MEKMKKEKRIAIFENKQIRRIWDGEKELWYFSVIDIIAVLTDQVDYNRAKTYWTTLKNRLKNEGSEVVTKCDRLKMKAIAKFAWPYLPAGRQVSEAELIFTALAEFSTRQFAETENAKGMEENKIVSKKGGAVAGNARKEIESKTGRKIISSGNFLLKRGAGKLK